MLNEKKDILKDAEFINELRLQRQRNAYEKSKNRLFILSIFLGLIIIGLVYFLSDASNIYRVVVFNNVYLKDEDIIELSELTSEDKYLLTIPKIVENKILKNQLIKECKVDLIDDYLVSITVQENKIIGYGVLDNNNVLILENNQTVILDQDNLYLIGSVPLIEGFTSEDLILIEKNLKDVDYKMINEISEMHYYPDLKFQNIELIMRDGNYVFTSVYGLNMLNRYYDIESSNKSENNNCYYFEDISGNAYMSACPWVNANIQESSDSNELID